MLATLALTAHPLNWIQTNLATSRRAKPVGLIESRSVMEIIIIIHHYDISVWLALLGDYREPVLLMFHYLCTQRNNMAYC